MESPKDVLLYAYQMLEGIKPEALRDLGLDVLLEKVDQVLSGLEANQEPIEIVLNLSDDSGVVVDSTTMSLTVAQISDIVDHAADLVLTVREHGLAGEELVALAVAELEDALVVAGVVPEEE